MGEVFLAEDELLQRRVALKRPASSLVASTEALDRFHREARAAAQLNHPNIAAIYDVLDHDDGTYIVMEYVDGKSLAEAVRSGPLPAARVVDIGVQIAEGLVAAHRRGIVHRDLKPANVCLTSSGQVKILDFGISKSRVAALTSDTPTVTEEGLTAPGQILGTPAYAAPEQLLGQPTDERTDVYGLGALLYELSTGHRPFHAEDTLGVALKAVTEAPVSITSLNSSVPPSLAKIIERALEKRPSDRYPSAGELGAALRGVNAGGSTGAVVDVGAETGPTSPRSAGARRRLVVAATLIAGLVLVAAAIFTTRDTATRLAPTAAGEASAARPVVAVLPAANLSGDSTNDFLGVGIADSLFTDLAALPGITVVPLADTRGYADEPRDGRAIARDLGATHVVDASLQRAGDRVRINVRLLGADGAVTWRSDFQGDVPSIFELQRRVSQGVVQGLRVETTAEERSRFGRVSTRNVEALSSYWRGRTLLERPDRAEGVDRAVDLFERAIALDDAFAEAYAGLGEACWEAYSRTKDPAWAQRALQASERALALDPAQARVLIAMALGYQATGQTTAAIETLERAIALQPNGDDAHRELGEVLASEGRIDEAIHETEQAIALRPGYWRNHQQLGVVFFQSGRYREAIAAFTRVTELQPDNASGFQALGTALQASGDLERSRGSYERALALEPNARAYSNLGIIHHWEGRFRDALEAYDRALTLTPNNPLLHRNRGDALEQLGKHDEALASWGVALSLNQRLLAVNPKEAATMAEAGVCQMKLGRATDAEQSIGEALALAPDDPDVLYARAAIHSLAGRPEAALAALRQALARGASAEVAARDEDFDIVRELSGYQAVLLSAAQR